MVKRKVLEFLETLLGYYVSHSERNYSFFSPFCIHHKPKLDVYFDSENGSIGWHCWISGTKGRSVEFLVKRMNKTEFRELARKLDREYAKSVNKASVEYIDSILSGDLQLSPVEPRRSIQFPSECIDIRQGDSIECRAAMGYLRRRGVTDCDIEIYGIKYSPSHGIVFPSYDQNDDLQFLISKDPVNGVYWKFPESNVNHVTWGNLITPNLPVISCEGSFDAITIGAQAVPKFGKYINPIFCRWAMNNDVEIIEFPDGDEPGLQSSKENILKLLSYDIRVRRVTPPKDKDPNDLGRERCLELIDTASRVTFENILEEMI